MADLIVQGSKLFLNGQEFVLKGTNVSGLNFVWLGSKAAGKAKVISSVNEIVDTWKFNTIRVNCRPNTPTSNNVGTSLHDNDNLEEIVNTFTARNVVVILDCGHDQTTGLTYGNSTTPSLNDLKTFILAQVTKFRNNPLVVFELMNEPVAGLFNQGLTQASVDSWIYGHQVLIKAIRDTGCTNIISVSCGSGYGQDGGNYNANLIPDSQNTILTYGDRFFNFKDPDVSTAAIKSYSNIIFTFHVYELWGEDAKGNLAGYKAKLADYLDKIIAKGYYVWVGEYGVGNAGSTNTYGVESLKASAYPRKVGRVVWHWYGGDANNLVTNGGSGDQINDFSGTKPTNLTYLGGVVWDDTHTTETNLSSLGVNISIVEPTVNNVYSKNQSVLIKAQLNQIPIGKTVTKVEFFDNLSLLGQQTTGVSGLYSFSTNALTTSLGKKSITVKATLSDGSTTQYQFNIDVVVSY